MLDISAEKEDDEVILYHHPMLHITTENAVDAMSVLPAATRRAINAQVNRTAQVVADPAYRAKELPRLVAKAFSDRNIPAFVVRPIR